MRILFSMSGSRGNVEPMVGLAVRVQALAAQFDTVVAGAEGCDARVSTGVMPTGGWR